MGLSLFQLEIESNFLNPSASSVQILGLSCVLQRFHHFIASFLFELISINWLGLVGGFLIDLIQLFVLGLMRLK
jgi:hypothetical protein